jgi:hypothetical protein
MGRSFPSDNCTIACENGCIDLLILRKSADHKYALIIENKVDNTVDQESQLERYFKKMRDSFDEKEIFAIYLPLRHRPPDKSSLGKVPPAQFGVISFECEIRNWLRDSIRYEQCLPQGLHENLKHYLDLINFLLRKEKEEQVSEQMLESLRIADGESKLPTYEEIQDLCRDAQCLADTYRKLLRAKLFSEVGRLLRERYPTEDAHYRAGNEKRVNDPYRIDDFVSVGVHIGDLVAVSAWTWGTEYFIGYRQTTTKLDAGFQEFISKRYDKPIQPSADCSHCEKQESPLELAAVGDEARRVCGLLETLHSKIQPLIDEYDAQKAALK